MKREFLMLAQPLTPKFGFMGAYASEKLDGVRCFYDGGMSRGKPCSEVPYANIAKHDRFVSPPIATGLWTRYGQPIQAPDSFLDKLPVNVPLDGELTLGRNTFQRTTSIVRSHVPSSDWDEIKYAIFDLPPYSRVFGDGTINNAFFKKTFRNLLAGTPYDDKQHYDSPFYERFGRLRKMFTEPGQIYVLEQRQISSASYDQADREVKTFFNEVLDLGGEGLILKSPICPWVPERTHMMVKMKGMLDDEATIIGYEWASPTNMTTSISGEAKDKLLGLMGCLTVQYKGKIFKLGSGFTEVERRMCAIGYTKEHGERVALRFGVNHPGETVNATDYVNLNFPPGTQVTFKYRELSDDGIPKEARYFRKREVL